MSALFDAGAPRTLFAAPARYLSRADCEAIAKKVLGFATADETRVSIQSGVSGNTRFAVNQVSTAGDTYDAVVTVRSHGNSYAQSWADVQFQRMPNVSLLPGEKDYVWEDLISATDRGVAIVGNGSFSIDQQRYNAQFGGQLFYEVKGGKVVGMLKDVAYQFRTPEFWGSLDMIGGKRSYWLGGANNDGKGQPSQSNAVSHGCVPSRFRNVNVINTGRTA